MKFYYYITYIISSPHTNLGSAAIELDYELNTFDALQEVKRIIAENFCEGKEPLILNWKRMEK